MSKTLFYTKVALATCFLSTHFIRADIRIVNSTSNNSTTIGTLPYWLLNANNGDTIDCTSIEAQKREGQVAVASVPEEAMEVRILVLVMEEEVAVPD